MKLSKRLPLLEVVIHKEMVHCVGDGLHYQMPLKHFLEKVMTVFEYWLRVYGFRNYAKDLGRIVEKYWGMF